MAGLRSVLGVAWITLREAQRGRLYVILLIFAAYVGAGLLLYPAADEESRFRQALSVSHGALQVGMGLVGLLLGVSALAADREGKRTPRCLATPVTRPGYVAGKAVALAVLCLVLAFALGAIEAFALRLSFRERPDLLRSFPLYPARAFTIDPDPGDAAREGDPSIVTVRPDRLVWTFEVPAGRKVREVSLGLHSDLPMVEEGRLWLQDTTGDASMDAPFHGDGGASIAVPASWDDLRELRIVLIHTFLMDTTLVGSLDESCRVRFTGGETAVARFRPEMSQASLQRLRTVLVPRVARWHFSEQSARKALHLRFEPYGGAGARGPGPMSISLQRGDENGAGGYVYENISPGEELPVPEKFRDVAGDLFVAIWPQQRGRGYVLDLDTRPDGSERNGLVLLGEPRAFEASLMLAALGAAALGFLMAGIGAGASLVLSQPAAVVLGLGVFLLGLGSGLVRDLPEEGHHRDPFAEVFGVETRTSEGLVAVASVAASIAPDIRRFDLKPVLVSSFEVRWARVVGLLGYGGSVGALALVAGALLFWRRDIP